MDMRRHLKRWLNSTALEQMGGTYEGEISEVSEETVRNRYTAKPELVPVVWFADGWRVVPNLGMRRDLSEMFGTESDGWLGQRIRIVLRCVERANKTTWVKTVARADTATGGAWRPTVVSAENVRADYDDGDTDMPSVEEIFGGAKKAGNA